LSLPPTPHAGLPTINVSRSGSEYQALAAKDSSQAWKSEAPVKPVRGEIHQATDFIM